MATHKTTFASLELHDNIAKAIAICGYTEPTPIQAQSIPSILDNKDIVACAQTGSGKTAAFVLPALHLLSSQPASKKTRILILTPTRELASQITKAASLYGKFLNFNIVNLVGGMPYPQQIRELQRGADIIVATPGRLLDHIEQGRVDLAGIQMLVLDEADRMLDMGFIDDVKYIAKLTPSSRQTLLFSATIGKGLAEIVKSLLKHPVKIDLSNDKIAAPKITQELYRVSSMQQKNRLLKHLLHEGSIYKAIIFSATKINADKLADQLCDDGFSAAALHGDLRQNVRNRTVEQLRSGKIQFLVATDVAARGIDISDVTHVINYDLPRFCEDYVHRIGRTGRAGKTGVAISFVGPADSRHLQNIERYLGERIKVANIDTGLLAGKHEKSSAHTFVADDRDDKPTRKFGNESRGRSEGGERSFDRSDKPKRSFGGESRGRSEGGERSFDRSDKPKRKYGSESGERSFDRSDKPKRSASSERGERSFDRSDKPKRSASSERGERSFDRSDKPKRAASSERGERSFDRSDKPKRAAAGERGERSFDRSDKPKRSASSERGERSFERSDKPKRKFGGEGRGRSEGSERGERTFDRNDKPKRKFGGESRGRSEGSPRGERSSDRSEKPKRLFGSSAGTPPRKPLTEKKRFDNVDGKAVEKSEGVRAFKKRSISKDKKFGDRRS